MNYEKAKEAFEKYIDGYNRKDKQIQLKYIHTYKVVELMAELAFRLGLSKEEIELAKVIGLLHDIGRFEQIKIFGEISDMATKMDHANFGYHYLFEDYHIRDYGIDENSEYAKIIATSIRNHNKFEIENILDEKSLFFTKMIRDMDKVDIFRTVAINFKMKLNADEVTKDVLSNFQQEKSIKSELLKTESDNTIQSLAFIFDINFDESFDILVETDNFDLFLGMVEVSENSEKLWKKLKEICFDKINRGVKDE